MKNEWIIRVDDPKNPCKLKIFLYGCGRQLFQIFYNTKMNIILWSLTEQSCVTQLVEVLDQIGTKLDRGGQVDIIYLDMSKAFDIVNHVKLLRKLHQYGFWGNLLTWLESYLHNWSQWVTILGATSSPLPVTSAVPRGSILRPMLFLLYVPDAVRSSQIAAFANHTKILKEITSTRDAEQLQEDLSNLVM